jgi:hypothetical protein
VLLAKLTAVQYADAVMQSDDITVPLDGANCFICELIIRDSSLVAIEVFDGQRPKFNVRYVTLDSVKLALASAQYLRLQREWIVLRKTGFASHGQRRCGQSRVYELPPAFV